MAMTSAFKAAWQRSNRNAMTLVKVELTSPSALTLYLSTAEVATPGSPPQVWQEALADLEPIRAPGSLRESSWSPASTGFTVLDTALAHQAAGARAIDVFHTHRWIGATVTVYLWETSLTSLADALQVFKGLVQDYEVEGFKANVRCLQRWDWNKEIDLVRVTRKRYPRAPEESVGKFLPKVRGRVRSVGLRPPWTSEFDTSQHGWEHVTGGRRALAGVLVDVGGGGVSPGTPSKVVFASHPCKTFFDPAGGYANGFLPYIAVDDKLCLFDSGTADVFNDATEGAGIKIGDDAGGTDPFEVAFYPVPAINVELYGSLDAENPRAVLDVMNETSYASLDYDANQRRIKVRLPNLSPAGDIAAINYAFGYSTTGGAGNVLDLEYDNGVDPPAGSTFAGSASPVFNSHLDATPNNNWNLGTIRIQFNGVQTGAKAKIFFIGAVVKFRPNREIVGQTTVTIRFPVRVEVRDPFTGEIQSFIVWKDVPKVVPVASYAQHKWFATIDGYADSGGTYTGNGTDLIQRAPDIAHHLLVLDGGESSADIETGVGAFGSFVDARTLLKTWRQSDMVHALVTSDEERVSQALERLAADAGCWFYLSEFDDKWKCVVWRAGSAVDYAPTLTVRDIAAPGLRLRPTPGTRRDTGIDVRYSLDQFRGRTTHDAVAGPGRSNAGLKYLNLRDQQFTIVSSGVEQNNKIDINTGAGDATATISAGAKTPATMMADVKTALVAARNTTWVTGHGATIVTGINDRLTIKEQEGAQSILVAVCAAGTYATKEDEMVAWTAALNAVSDSFTVSYSRTTRKVAIARAGNTFQVWVDATPADYTGCIQLGFVPQSSGSFASSHAATYETEEERFVIGNTDTGEAFTLEWETGTNGTNGNNVNAANVLGYDAARDQAALSGQQQVRAICPTNTREQAIEDITAVTGEKRARLISNDTIYDDDTAREVRDRATDLLCTDRPEVAIPLFWQPDIDRGRVIEFDASPDELWPYAVDGSDGSWAGKKFQIAGDKVQHIAGSYMTEYVGIEIS